MNEQDQGSAGDDLPPRETSRKGGEFVAPRTPVEELLVGLYGSSLNLSCLGIYDDLSSLGLTPERATQIKQALEKIFRVDIPIGQLLLCPTIDALGQLLSDLWDGRDIVEEIAWTFLQIEALTDDDVKCQLALLTSNFQ